MENVSLIDISSEDDLLIPSSSQEFVSEAASTLGAEYTERVSKQMVQASVLSESPQQKRRRSDRFSMRKSLAWDSEFFTSEGVLNPEELAIINCTYNKAVGIILPGIDEELSKSTESASTLNSGSCALENLEVHLFQNLKASIQKSLVDSTQAANKLPFGKTKGQRKPDVPCMKTLKKLDVTSQSMLKLPTMLKRHGTAQQQESTSNDGIVDVKLAASGDCEAKISSKPLKVSTKTIPLPAMRGKSGYSVTKQIKSNREKAFPGTTAKRQPILTVSRSNNDQGITCRSSIPSKASSSCTPRSDFILVAASCSSSSSLASSSSDSKSSSSLVTKRNAERNNSSSRLFGKTPARTNRSRPGSTEGSSLSNSEKSTLALSKVSPTSSINNFPKVSSSQKSTTKLWFSKSLEVSDGELSSSSSIADSSGNGGSQKSGALSRSFAGNNSKINLKFDADTKDATSLGLRMPRPRIGYFDKEKTLVGSSDKYLQTSLKKSYVKNTGINETAAATKRKHSNLPFIRAGAHLYTSTNLTSKSVEAQILHKNLDKHQELPPKVKKEASMKSSKGNSKLNFREAGVAAVRAESNWSCSLRKKEQPNLLQPKHVAMANETHPTAEQRIDDQSWVMHAQQEHVQSGLNVAARSTEKENLCPASKAGYQSKAPRSEDEHKVAVAMLGNMVSSLSLSEVQDVITRD